jgi:LPS sulfotransferase NodH
MLHPGSEEERAARGQTRFVVLSAPRTGSNWLCTLLDSHPDILCHHELFNPKGIHYALGLRDGSFSLGTKEERDRDPLGLLARAFATHLGHGAVGFKINWSQDARVFDAVLRDVEVKKILTVRRNRIKTFVSELIAEQTGQWESYIHRSPRGDVKSLRVDREALAEHIGRNERYYADLRERLRATERPYIEVAYEDLESDEEHARILGFLGVAPPTSRLEAATFKRNPSNLKDLISNYEELASALAGSPLSDELASMDL